MANVIKAAMEKISDLRRQISELERFIELHDTLAGKSSLEQKIDTASGRTGALVNVAGNTTQQPVDNSKNLVVKSGTKVRPDYMAELVERIIREVGRPMTRGEIVSALQFRDVAIPYQDKARYIGTIMWRHKGKFLNLEKRGYWLRDAPIPPNDLPYQPSLDPTFQ